MRCVSSRPERWERVTWRGRVAGRRLEPAGQRAAPGRTGCPAVRVGLGGPASGAEQDRGAVGPGVAVPSAGGHGLLLGVHLAPCGTQLSSWSVHPWCRLCSGREGGGRAEGRGTSLTVS